MPAADERCRTVHRHRMRLRFSGAFCGELRRAERMPGKPGLFSRAGYGSQEASEKTNDLVAAVRLWGQFDLDEVDDVTLHGYAVDLMVLKTCRSAVGEPCVPASKIAGRDRRHRDLVAGGLPVQVRCNASDALTSCPGNRPAVERGLRPLDKTLSDQPRDPLVPCLTPTGLSACPPGEKREIRRHAARKRPPARHCQKCYRRAHQAWPGHTHTSSAPLPSPRGVPTDPNHRPSGIGPQGHCLAAMRERHSEPSPDGCRAGSRIGPGVAEVASKGDPISEMRKCSTTLREQM